MIDPSVQTAVDSVPPGAWALGVSGGADSVAMLMLLRQRADLRLHVVNLDHETRRDESALDARFVSELCARCSIPATIVLRSEIEPTLGALPSNRSARYRRVRFALFGRVVREQALDVCRLSGAHERTEFRATSLETLRQMVAANVGVTLLPTLAIKPPVARSDNIHLLRFADSHPSRSIAMVWRRSSAMAGFLARLARVFADLPPGLLAPDDGNPVPLPQAAATAPTPRSDWG